jgi:hypothetical protein
MTEVCHRIIGIQMPIDQSYKEIILEKVIKNDFRN